MNQEKIGKFIADCRKQNNFTQEELSKKLGVSAKSISGCKNSKSISD